MIILSYQKKHHAKIIHACVLALKKGSVLAYPTDTSYGLAVDATNKKAVEKLYKIKGRNFNKPSSVVVPSILYAKKLVKWNGVAEVLTKKFWPRLRQGFGGQARALTIALLSKNKEPGIRKLTSPDGYLSLRMPKNQVALDLATALKKPITATSANLSGMQDCYSAQDIVKQFEKQKFKPDIIINTGKLFKRKPSTVIKIISDEKIEIIRIGPISEKQIIKALTKK